MLRFYGYFASAYGTFWFVGFLVSLGTQNSVQMGQFGYCGFPVIAFIYALIRVTTSENQSVTIAQLQYRIEILTEIIEEYEEKRAWLVAQPDKSTSTDIEPAG